MKKMIVLLVPVLLLLAGCSTEREIQVELVRVQLVRIDTIVRYTQEPPQQRLIWKDDHEIEYVSYERWHSPYILGSSVLVLKRR